ncbi:MAG: fumarylacetoacetate hydrolase family protein [Acetobacteraceae bacterium]|nr:fumarylacetoacetate hydrolase family protein [Acetobacteraceae bacterium]
MPALLSPEHILPADSARGSLAGRIWRPDRAGPSVVAIRPDGVFDVSAAFPTMTDLTEEQDPAAALRAARGERVAGLDELLANTDPAQRDSGRPWLLAPIDLHVIKAAGVTFPLSMLERVIEERAKGDPGAAAGIRDEIGAVVGGNLQSLKPGSAEAAKVKALLIEQGLWSQYLEVGIGPDAEIFTKAPILSAVGVGAEAGLHPSSSWNNPEPEVVLVVASTGAIVGATLGNDVNLRDIEGRSALLLSKAKDNNASCAIGPFIRLFDDSLSLDDVRAMEVSLLVEGEDGFTMEGSSSLRMISRDPADLVGQMLNGNHQYPDGAVLFLGTMFAPVKDRGAAGQGFTHRNGDIVSISTPKLGRLVNKMRPSDACPPWTFGVRDLMRSVARRPLAPIS